MTKRQNDISHRNNKNTHSEKKDEIEHDFTSTEKSNDAASVTQYFGKDDVDKDSEDICVENDSDKGKRLDIFLSEQMDFTRSRIKKLADENAIFVNGKNQKSSYSISVGDVVKIILPETTFCNAAPQNLPIDIIYEDVDIAVINKAQGMVTHPSDTTPSGTLVNALMYHMKNLSTINGVIRPGIVHRLDKDTSGLLVIAKNDKAHLSLAEQISTKTARRIYIALVDGNIKADGGIVNEPIGRSKRDRKLMAISAEGRNALTIYTVLARYGLYTLVEYELKTGRTHQIRVHSKHLGHPVVGDKQYGGSDKFGLNGQLLHAKKLIIKQPTSSEIMEFSAPLPEYFQQVLKKIEHLKK